MWINTFRASPWPALFSVSIVSWLGLLLTQHVDSSAHHLIGGKHVHHDGEMFSFGEYRSFDMSYGEVASDLLMILAMMVPLLAAPIMHVWQASLARRRVWALLAFVVGYAFVWLTSLPLLERFALWLLTAGPAVAFLIAGATAVVWSSSPWHRAALNRSHRFTHIGLAGRKADMDCLLFGIVHGFWCFATCWALMMLPMTAGAWHFPVMLAAGVAMFLERLTACERPRWRWAAFVPFLGRVSALRGIA